jgi:hypothetical protein
MKQARGIALAAAVGGAPMASNRRESGFLVFPRLLHVEMTP